MYDRSDPPRLEEFPVHEVERLRFGDLDRQGHVNNVAFAELMESGRIYFFRDENRPVFDDRTASVVARVAIDYLGELHWPGEVKIGTGVTSIGKSSISLFQGLYDGDRCAAVCESVIVVIDRQSRKAASIPPASRAVLETLVMKSDRFMQGATP